MCLLENTRCHAANFGNHYNSLHCSQLVMTSQKNMNKISQVHLVYFKINYNAAHSHIDLSYSVCEWYYFMCFMCINF